MMAFRVVFVTGATGFVGLNVVDECLSRGWEVHALHRPGSKRAQMLLDLPNAKNSTGNSKLVLVEGTLDAPPAQFVELVPPTTGANIDCWILHVSLHTNRITFVLLAQAKIQNTTIIIAKSHLFQTYTFPCLAQ